jgi:pyruvate dehydrogenase E2 component (dihydrolipoamide acetyltransferase)
VSDQESASKDSGRHLVKATPMRNAIARRMSQSKQQAPHFYVSCEIAMDAAIEAVSELNANSSSDVRVTQTAVLLKAVALTLADEPEFNAHWTDRGHELIDAINIGVAIDVPAGLIAPAIVDCGDIDVSDFSMRLKDLANRAKSGKLRGPEMNDATFTLSNLGMFDVSSFTAIVTPPQVAILATGRSVPKPRAVDGEVKIKTVMTATLSSDHRAVDGIGAARFLGKFKARLESPSDWI